MTRETHKTIVFIGILSMAAVAVFLRSLPVAPSAHWQDLAVFVGLAALSEKWYVSTSQESGMSLSFTVHFAAAVLFGPAFAMVIAACGLLITDGLIRRPPLVRTTFNVAQMALSVGLCGLAYQALQAAGPIDLVADAPALAVSALVYLLVNDTLVAGVLSLHGRSFIQEWRLTFKDILLPYVSMAPLGALAAYAYQAAPVALLYFVPLVLVVYNGFKLFVSLQHETDSALVALADSIDRRDQYTFEHSQRVAERVEGTARELGVSPREIELMAAAARVHDLGKIATDNRLLLKPSTLTPEERRLMERHAVEGEGIAGKFSMFRRGRLFIRHHHERWDGTGYPDGLAGEQIPLGARLIAVADSFDAMTSDRPHRKALSQESAVMELRHCAGTQFDPAIVQAFIRVLDGESASPENLPSEVVARHQSWLPNDLIAELSDRRDPAQLWMAVGFTISRWLDVPNCDVYRLDTDGEPACAASVRGGAWYPDYLGRHGDLSEWAAGRTALATKAFVLISSSGDPRLGQRERAEMKSWNEHTKAVLPLLVKDEVIGLVEVGETRTAHAMSAEQLATAESVCQLIALAIHDAQAIEDQRLHARRLASLLESSRAVAGATSAEEAVTIVARRAAELLDATCCVVYEHDADLDALVARAVWEREPSGLDRVSEPLPLAECPSRRDVLVTGQTLVECLSDDNLAPVTSATFERWGEKSCLTVPMPSVDGAMGLLTLWDSKRERFYTDEELALATSVGELAGEAVRSARLLRRLRSLSETDALTGLANRRKLHEFLAPIHARAERYGTHFSLAMLDIDGFKVLNDTWGHPSGDSVLRHVAQILTEHTRGADIVGRYGGDEFLIILPETAPAEAVSLAKKLRTALAETPCETTSGEHISVHASFGVGAYPDDGRDLAMLIAVADANLYASKRVGGDAVTGSSEPGSRPAIAPAPARQLQAEPERECSFS